MNATVQLSFEVRDSDFHFYFPDAELASSARALFIACVRGQTEPECDLFGAELAFGEILGNVARHAPGPVEIHFFWEEAGARLEVWDHGTGYELDASLGGLLDESHRGLFLASQYTAQLRVERRGARTVTSALLSIQRADPRAHPARDRFAQATQ
jgi:anti-sigma regulatory factor (Ser/Thr protein kinase)